jgi:hypothetical protein
LPGAVRVQGSRGPLPRQEGRGAPMAKKKSKKKDKKKGKKKK